MKEKERNDRKGKSQASLGAKKNCERVFANINKKKTDHPEKEVDAIKGENQMKGLKKKGNGLETRSWKKNALVPSKTRGAVNSNERVL